MNNKIKEMLKLHIEYEIDLLPKNQQEVLDYISNLQQELEEYKDTETYSKRFLYKANKDRLNANLDLVKENERLKTKTKEQSLLLIDYQDMEQKLEKYKSRIEKAVEYISSNCILSREWEEVEFCKFLATETITYKALSRGKIKELLNILNGRSDE